MRRGAAPESVTGALSSGLTASCWLPHRLCQEPNGSVDGRQEKVEHPTVPYGRIVVDLLLLIVVPDAEVVDDVEEVLLILGDQDSLESWTQVLQHIGKIADRVPSISVRRIPAPKLEGGRSHPPLDVLRLIYRWQFRRKKRGEFRAGQSQDFSIW